MNGGGIPGICTCRRGRKGEDEKKKGEKKGDSGEGEKGCRKGMEKNEEKREKH